MDMGAFVVVINAEKVQVSGNKFDDKMYFNQHYNGKPGSAKMEAFKDLQKVGAGHTPHSTPGIIPCPHKLTQFPPSMHRAHSLSVSSHACPHELTLFPPILHGAAHPGAHH